MATLRKSCRSCTTAKRKCIVQLPRCIRCAQKGLDCMYDLDHVVAPKSQPTPQSDLRLTLTEHDAHGHCFLKTLQTRGPEVDPAVGKPGKQSNVDFIRLGFAGVPEFIREGKPGMFYHPKLHLSEDHYRHLAPLEREGGVTYDGFEHLIELDIKTVPIQEALTALQALLAYMGTFVFSPVESERMGVELNLSILSEWTEYMLASAQTSLPRSQSLWQAWLFGESVRRTISMSYGLCMTLNCFKYGYCANWLFLESLPFDRRPGLWMATSPQAWIAAAGVKSSAEVGEILSSFHEFAVEYRQDGGRSLCGDLFLSVVIWTHNGVLNLKS